MSKRGKPAPISIVMAQNNGVPLAQIAQEHDLTRSQLRTVLAQHSRYCFGRVEGFMLRRVKP